MLDEFDTSTPPQAPVYMLTPTSADMQLRRQYESLQGSLVLGMLDGIVEDISCAPNPYPIMPDPTNDNIPGLDQLPYYPANAGTNYSEIGPLIFPSKGLHQILKIG